MPEPSTKEVERLLGLFNEGRFGESAAKARKLTQRYPDNAFAWKSLGACLNLQGKKVDAIASMAKAAELDPGDAEIHFNLGTTLNDLERRKDAEPCFRRAIALKPDYIEALNNLGSVLIDLGRLGEAEAVLRQAVDYKPEGLEAHYNLGNVLRRQRRFDEAERCFRRALELQPGNVEVRHNLGFLLLSLGRYAEGWPYYEDRYHPQKQGRTVEPPELPFPRWNGEPLAGKSLLVWPEQGFGDEIQFARYLPLLKARGVARLTLVCKPPLKALLESVAGTDSVVVRGEPVQPHDYWVFPLSLPLLLATTLESIPAALPYLSADTQRIEQWRPRLPAEGFRIGLVWRGSPAHGNDANRSLPGLATLAPLWSVPSVRFVSLQKGSGEEEAKSPPAGQEIVALGHRCRDFADTAAIVAQLDLVICVDTAVAHLTGALGKPCWVLLPAAGSDWRWMHERSDSPWYPGVMRLFRQTTAGQWASVIAQVAQALQSMPAIVCGVPGNDPDPAEIQRVLTLFGAERYSECAMLAGEMTRRHPNDGLGWKALGASLNMLGNKHKAADALLRSVTANPDDPEAHFNLGATLNELERWEEAESAFHRAIALNPGYIEALNNLGSLLKNLGRFDEAADCYRRVLDRHPEQFEASYNLGYLLLSLGRFTEGGPYCEARYRPDWKDRSTTAPDVGFPQWQGQSLLGKSLLVWPEQGYGDEIQFARYVAVLKAQGVRRLTLICRPQMKDLLRRLAGVDRLLTQGEPIDVHDYWDFELSLPFHLGTTLETIPATLPYLSADPQRIEHWRSLLPETGFKVGLVWRGNPKHKNDRCRSLPGLATLAPLWAVPDVTFVSLQKGQGEEDALSPPDGQSIVAIGHRLADFADTATVVAQLDLVICIDTSIAHLAGALGKPCWVLLPAVGTDWRWMQERSDSPWYPGVMRLFRQNPRGEWKNLVDKVADALRQQLAYLEVTDRPADVSVPKGELAQLTALFNLQRFAECAALAKPLVERYPRSGLAWYVLGGCLMSTGRNEDALMPMHQAAILDSGNPEIHCNLGVITRRLGRLSEAEGSYRRAIDLKPDYAEAHYNLGITLKSQGRLEEAESCYRRAIEAKPDYTDALLGLGNSLKDQEKYLDAEIAYRRATEIRPDHAQSHYNLGTLLSDQLRLSEAETSLRRAIALAPRHEKAYGNLANVLKEAGHLVEAEACYRQAIALKPDYPNAHANLGILLLSLGRYSEGWSHYEARHDPAQTSRLVTRPQLPFPQWQGESLAGKSLLLWPEQGFGDEIQFVRYGTSLKSLGLAKLTIVCKRPLCALLQTASGVDTVIAQGDAVSRHDYWTFPLSLPLHLGTTLETIPATLPYLSADPQCIEQWRPRLPKGGFKVGLVWRGNPEHKNDQQRSLPGLAAMASWWSVPGVTFVSLQKGQGEDEALSPPDGQAIVALGHRFADFADTAAVVAQLDLVICVDTSIAHLAGALGKPCWILLPATGTDWRWMHERSDSPWYPGVIRLFRQKSPGSWSKTIDEVVEALRELPACKPDFEHAGNLPVPNDELRQLTELFNQKRFAECAALATTTVERYPRSGFAWYLLGGCLMLMGRNEEALAPMQQAIALDSGNPEVHCNLGIVMRRLSRLDEAEANYRRAINLKPDYAEAHYNLGLTLKHQGRYNEAETSYRRAIEAKPDYVDALANLGLLLLLLGRYSEGWVYYESRFRADKIGQRVVLPDLPFAEWRGEPLAGKSLVIWPEQGFGDAIQFVRYAPLLKAKGVSRLTLVCKPSLKDLLRTVEGIDTVAVQGDSLAPHDFWVLALSPPLYLRTTLDTVPAALPYVRAGPERIAWWKGRLPTDGFKVGLVWRGSATHQNDANRSLPGLSALAPLWAVPGVRFVSLQKGKGEDEASAPPAGQAIVALGAEIKDFADTAAIIAQLDLVICVDTSVAHLAGALGKPCWVLLPARGSDWRWLLDRADSPWYPGVLRLFRQVSAGDWKKPIDDVAHQLKALIASKMPDLQKVPVAQQAGTLVRSADSARNKEQPDEAEQLYRQAITLDPKHVQAHFKLALALNQFGRSAEAEAEFRAAVELQPDFFDAHIHLGNLLKRQGKFAAAESFCRRAVELRPDQSFAHFNLGNVLFAQRKLVEAETGYRQAIALYPDYQAATVNLGSLLRQMGRLSEAETAFRNALKINPELPEGRWNLSLLLLAQGRLAEAWPYYEARYDPAHRDRITTKPKLPFPQWMGESLAGKSLMVLTEQGMGDEIQFARYLPLLKEKGAMQLTLVCHDPLKTLLRSMPGIDSVIGRNEARPAHDYWTFLLSLPLQFGTTLENIPATLPYLYADPQRIAHWKDCLPQNGWKVGLVWRGSANYGNDIYRSLPGLSTLAPLWSVSGVHFFSLQKGPGEDEAKSPPDGQPLFDLGSQVHDFADTAAIVAQLDLVISVDTSVAHLAGALGKPCWILLPAIGTDWRWLSDRTDCPWYPGVVRLFRQEEEDRWEGVVTKVATALSEYVDRLPRRVADGARSVKEQESLLALDGKVEAISGIPLPEMYTPEDADAHVSLGNIRRDRGDLAAAEESYRRALMLKADCVYALFGLGLVLNSFGRFAEAESSYRRAIALKSDFVQAHGNLGNTLKDQGRYAEAEVSYRRAIELQPGYALGCFNLGTMLCELKRDAEAESLFRRAIDSQPDHVEAHINLANLLKEQRNWDGAESSYRRALQLRPGSAVARHNLGLLLLTRGRYREGWPYYEARYQPELENTAVVRPGLVFPQWQGEPLTGKSLLVWPEQGLGDEIQFARYLPLLKARGPARLTLACSPPLKPLLQSIAGVDAVLTTGETLAPHDYWVFPLSLPLYFDTRLETLPARLPYLSAYPQRVALWKERLPQNGWKVGLVWRGSARHGNDANRSLPSLATLQALWKVPGFVFVSLQKGAGEEEAVSPPAGQPILPLGRELNDFADTAAIIAQLDLVICVDTSIAHLAGALGKACWVLLPAIGTDWRWLHERSDSPWYPGVMRLFRQKTAGVWEDTVAEVAQALMKWAAERKQQAPPGYLPDTPPEHDVNELLALFRQQCFDEGLVLATSLTQRYPRSAFAWKALGACLTSTGRIADAIGPMQKATALDGNDAEAHLNLALALKRSRRPDEAARSYQQFVRLQPNHVGAHLSLAGIFNELRCFADAEQSYRWAIELEPTHFRAHGNLGNVLKEQGRLDEAETHYRRAIALKSDYVHAHFNLGVTLQDGGRFADAEECYRRVIVLKPDHIDAYTNLGTVLTKQGRLRDAETSYRQGLAFKAESAELHINLAALLLDQKRLTEAEDCCRKAIVLQPGNVHAHGNLGNILLDQDRFDEAEASYRRAIELDPAYAPAYGNLANDLMEQARLVEAESCFRRAIELDTNYAQAKRNLGMLLLSQGRYAEGWQAYEARYDPKQGERWIALPKLSFPQWAGEPLAGKSILLWPEQGLGDEIQFARYVPLLKAHGASHVSLVSKPQLIELLATVPELDAAISQGEAIPPHDYWSLPLSLPLHLKTTLENIPTDLPYLRADPQRLAVWRMLLPQDGFKVGLVWRGNADHKNDAHRSLPSLSTLAPLWQIEGVHFISLQKGQGEDEAKSPPPGQPLLDLGSEVHDFADTAAIVAQLDLVICVDTSIAHLAGALGKPCWVLLPAIGTDWRWLHERCDSPWYPGVLRLFRQTTPGTWDETIAGVARQLGMARGERSTIPAHDESVVTDHALLSSLFEQRRFEDGLALATRLTQHAPNDTFAWKAIGVCLTALGRTPEAIAPLQQAASIDADDIEAHRNLALALKRSGRKEEAARSYRQVIRLHPEDVSAHLNLGGILSDLEQFPDAERCYRQAIQLKPEVFQAHGNLANVLKAQGRLGEAEDSYRHALRLNPAYVHARFNLGIALQDQERFDEAESCYRKVIELKPDHFEAFINLGTICAQQRRFADSENAYRRAIELKPEFLETYINLSNVLYEQQRFPEAETLCRRAIEIEPDNSPAHCSLGRNLTARGRLDEAEACCQRALELMPGFMPAHVCLGNIFLEQRKFRQAEHSYRKATELSPESAQAHYNLALALRGQDCLVEAESSLNNALRLDPDYLAALICLGTLLTDLNRLAEAEGMARMIVGLNPDLVEDRWNASLFLLALGRCAEAWPLFEARYDRRLKSRRTIPPVLGSPQWAGDSLDGKSLLIWPEQGFGDEIQFSRYAALMKSRGASRVTLVTKPPLKTLLQTLAGVDQVITEGEAIPPHDIWTFPMSVPLHLSTTLETIPAQLPYLGADPQRNKEWRCKLPTTGYKIGLVWKGSAGHDNDAHRSLPSLSTLAPLWQIEGVHFISLQKGQGEDEAKSPPPGQPLLDLGSEVHDFADTAAIVAQLDLVICVDTSIAHLAGALGKPCWVLLPAIGTDWRWLHERCDSPWYPGVLRLFRQTAPGAWDETIAELAQALKAWAGKIAKKPARKTPERKSRKEATKS